MRRVAIMLVLAACGPTVAVDDGGTTTDASTTSVSGADPTSAETAMTSASTTVATTTPSDEATSIEPTSTDGESSDSGFIMKPDFVCFTHCTQIECDLWAQDCPEGSKCSPWGNDGGDAWNASRCTPLDRTPAAIGEICVVEGSGVSGIDDCGVGAICWGVDPVTLEGECVAFCGESEANPMCADPLSCFSGFDGYVNVCVPPCDPLGSACAADEVCAQYTYASFDPTERFSCLPVPPFEPQAYGLPCGGLQVCDAGLMCVEGSHFPECEGIGCCTVIGDIAAPPVCPDAMQTCIPFEPDATEGPCFCGVPA